MSDYTLLDAAQDARENWFNAFAELLGYIQNAIDYGDEIDPEELKAYLWELRRNALRPVAELLTEGARDGE